MDAKLELLHKLLNEPSAYGTEPFKKYLPSTPTGYASQTEEGNPLIYRYKNDKDATGGYRVLMETRMGPHANKMNSFFNHFNEETSKAIENATNAGNYGVASDIFNNANVNPNKFNYGTQIQIPFIIEANKMARTGKKVYVGQSDIKKFWPSVSIHEGVRSVYRQLFNGKEPNAEQHGQLKGYLKEHNYIQTFHDPQIDALGVKSEHFPLTSGGQMSRFMRVIWGGAMQEIAESAKNLGVWHRQWEDDAVMLSHSKENLMQHLINVQNILHRHFGSKVNNHEVVDYTNPLNADKQGKSGIHDYYMPLTQFKEVTHLNTGSLEPTQDIHDRFSAGNTHAYDNLIAKNEILGELGFAQAAHTAKGLRRILTDNEIDMDAPEEQIIKKTSNTIKPELTLKFNPTRKNSEFTGAYTKYNDTTKVSPSHNDIIEQKKIDMRNETWGKERVIKGVLE